MVGVEESTLCGLYILCRLLSMYGPCTSPWRPLKRYLDIYEIVLSGFYSQRLEIDFADISVLDFIQTLDALNFRHSIDEIEKASGVRLLALIFGRPSLPLVQNQIIPDIEYWDYVSDKNIDFVSVGFNGDANKFNPVEFEKIKNDFEQQCTWIYSHETDLVLLNAHINNKKVELDFEHVVSVTLERAIEDKAIASVSEFFGRIIEFAKNFEGTDPAWGFSDYQGKKIVGSALKRLLISLLPESLREETRKAFHFYVKDYSKKD